MNIEFGTSNRGRPTLIYQGYEYVKKQETNKTTHWLCRHYRQIKCSSLVITSGSEIIKTPEDHNCNFKPGATEARQAKNKMKEKALTTTNYVAIASTLQEIQNDVATQMNSLASFCNLLAISKKPTLEVLAEPHYLKSGIKTIQLLQG